MSNPIFLFRETSQVIRQLKVADAPRGTITRYIVHLVTDGIGAPVYVPVLVARGLEDGPVVGLTAAVHGNELNGIPVVQRIFQEIDLPTLRGTLVGIPIVNVPSLHRNQREFVDSVDLNDIMPGKADGNVSEVYAYRTVNWIVREFDYLVDLHTASSGRINSWYIRADMDDPVTRKMALLQNAEIIVHNPPSDGTLRGAAAALGIHAITLELGNPATFQRGIIRSGLIGVHNLLSHLGMTDDEIIVPETPPAVCRKSYWLYTDTGGILTVYPELKERLEPSQVIGTLRNVFGDLVREYLAPEKGIVVGKSIYPINQTGGRILHLGIEHEAPSDSEVF
jgi:predicted deacylase